MIWTELGRQIEKLFFGFLAKRVSFAGSCKSLGILETTTT